LNHWAASLLKAVSQEGESLMPWYAWLILVIAIGSIVGGLLMLKDSAKKLPLTDEQLKRVHERNAEMDAKEARDR
jgi:hypothetical protein